MAAGQMRDRITFRKQTRVQLNDGGWDTVNLSMGTVPADIRPVAGREGERAGRQFGHTSFVVRMYAGDKPAGFSTDWLLRWETAPKGPVDFDVRSIVVRDKRDLMFEVIGELSDDGGPQADLRETPETALVWGGEAIRWGGEFITWGSA